MTPSQFNINDIKLPSGRSLGQCRKDAKRKKRELNISMQDALNATAKKQGILSSWQSMAIRCKALFGTIIGVSRSLGLGKNTFLLGGTGSYISNIVYAHWRESLNHQPQVADVVIDVRGDPLACAVVANTLQEEHPSRTFKLFSLLCEGVNGKPSQTQLIGSSASSIKSIASVLFPETKDREMAENYLHGRKEGVYSGIKNRIDQSSRSGLLLWLSLKDDQGWPVTQIFDTNTTTLFTIPSITKGSEEYRSILPDILSLCRQQMEAKGIRMRITISGLHASDHLSDKVIDWLFNTDNLEVTLQSEYPFKHSSEWISQAAELAEQTYASKAPDEHVPAVFRCLSTQLQDLEIASRAGVPVMKFNKGVLLDLPLSLGVVPFSMPKKMMIPLHNDGSSIT
jgi:hypothetical protein